MDQIRLLIFLEYENVCPGWSHSLCFLLPWRLSTISYNLVLVHGLKKPFFSTCVVAFSLYYDCSLITIHFADWKPTMVLFWTLRYWNTCDLEGLPRRLPSQLLHLSIRLFCLRETAGVSRLFGLKQNASFPSDSSSCSLGFRVFGWDCCLQSAKRERNQLCAKDQKIQPF